MLHILKYHSLPPWHIRLSNRIISLKHFFLVCVVLRPILVLVYEFPLRDEFIGHSSRIRLGETSHYRNQLDQSVPCRIACDSSSLAASALAHLQHLQRLQHLQLIHLSSKRSLSSTSLLIVHLVPLPTKHLLRHASSYPTPINHSLHSFAHRRPRIQSSFVGRPSQPTIITSPSYLGSLPRHSHHHHRHTATPLCSTTAGICILSSLPSTLLQSTTFTHCVY